MRDQDFASLRQLEAELARVQAQRNTILRLFRAAGVTLFALIMLVVVGLIIGAAT